MSKAALFLNLAEVQRGRNLHHVRGIPVPPVSSVRRKQEVCAAPAPLLVLHHLPAVPQLRRRRSGPLPAVHQRRQLNRSRVSRDPQVGRPTVRTLGSEIRLPCALGSSVTKESRGKSTNSSTSTSRRSIPQRTTSSSRRLMNSCMCCGGGAASIGQQ